MTDPFYSPKRRIARAKYHIRDLEAQIETFLKEEPYARVVEPDDDGVNQLHKIKLNRSIPDDFASIAVDALTNLRSALDQAGFATAIAAGKTTPKSAYFPFADSAADLANVIKGRCKDIPPDIATLLLSFQPYKGGNDLLWAMNKMRNASEHGLLATIGIASGGMYIRHMVLGGGTSMPVPRWDRKKNEIVFAISGPQANIEYDIDFSFFVAFNDVEIVDGQPAIPVLDKLASEVERIVLAIEAETRRIGLIT